MGRCYICNQRVDNPLLLTKDPNNDDEECCISCLKHKEKQQSLTPEEKKFIDKSYIRNKELMDRLSRK